MWIVLLFFFIPFLDKHLTYHFLNKRNLFSSSLLVITGRYFFAYPNTSIFHLPCVLSELQLALASNSDVYKTQMVDWMNNN